MTKEKTTHKRKPYWLCCVSSRYMSDPNGLPRFGANMALYAVMPSIVESLTDLGYHVKKSRTGESFGSECSSIDVSLFGFKSKTIPKNKLEEIASKYKGIRIYG